MSHRLLSVVTALAVGLAVLLLAQQPASGQAVWARDTPKLPMARSWLVEVTGLNGRGWFDSTGQFYSENTRMIERWRLVDANTIDYEVTIEDPTIYTRPWKMNFPKRRPGTGPREPRGVSIASTLPALEKDPYEKEMWERACYEGNGPTVAGVRSLGYTWFSGVTPPK